MSHIIATTQSGNSIIVENFVKNAKEALHYWKTQGMQNVKYSIKKLSKAECFHLEH